MKRIVIAAMGLLLVATAAQAADACGPVKMINQVQMHRIEGDTRDSVTFAINGQCAPRQYAIAPQ